MSRIVCFHLFNDYSGSPRVLKVIIEGLLERRYNVDLVTSSGGVLSELVSNELLKVHSYGYKFVKNEFVAFIVYFFTQLFTFIYSFKYLFNKGAVFYINTLLPVGPALAGFLMRKKVIYHYHENAFVKGFSYRVLCHLMQMLATKIICVSSFQKQYLKRSEKIVVIQNSVSKEFYNEFVSIKEHELSFSPQILMLSSLKMYKGVLEFIALSEYLIDYKFCLVINDTQRNIDIFLRNNNVKLNSNIIIYSKQKNIISFYKKSDIVVNLTNPKFFIETFGLTILEAMTASLPVIVPVTGGVADLVENGFNGYKIDVSNLVGIANTIQRMLNDKDEYLKLSINAKKTSEKYSYSKMIHEIKKLINE